MLLGLVVERASGQSLPDFLEHRIFQPLHMDHALLYVHDNKTVLLSNRNDPEPYHTALAIAQPYLEQP